MFQIINSDVTMSQMSQCHRLSHVFKEVNSVRKGKLIEMNTTTSEFGRQSLFFRGPVSSNNLDRDKKCRKYEFFYLTQELLLNLTSQHLLA